MSVLNALSVSRKPAAAFVVIGLYWGTFAAFVPVIKARLGASDALFGSLLLGTAIGLVTAMFFAPRIDKWLTGRTMQLSSVLVALAFLAPGLASTPTMFFFAMVLAGTASGLTDVIMNARVSELEAQHGKSLMNANHAMFSVAYAIAAIVTGIAREVGLPPIAVFAGMGVLTFALAGIMVTPVAADPDDEATVTGFPWGPILLCGAIVQIAFMSEATVEAWSALHIERTLNGGAAEGALGPATLGIMMAIGRFSGQAVSERLSDYLVIVCAALLSAVGALIVAVAATPILAYVGFGVLGLGVSVIGPLGLAIVGRLVAPKYRTEAISKAAVIGFSGFFLAPIVMGGVSELFGLRVAFACVAGLLMLLLPLVSVTRRRAPV